MLHLCCGRDLELYSFSNKENPHQLQNLKSFTSNHKILQSYTSTAQIFGVEQSSSEKQMVFTILESLPQNSCLSVNAHLINLIRSMRR